MNSGQEGGVRESYPKKGVNDAYLERVVGDTYSEMKFGDSRSDRGLSEIGVGDSYQDKAFGDKLVVPMQREEDFQRYRLVIPTQSGHCDTYSGIGVEDSQTESQFNCHLPVTSYSPIVNCSRSRCELHSNAHTTSLTEKLQEGRFLSCRCESCRETKEMLGKKDWKVHKDSSSRFSLGETARGRCISGSSCGPTEREECLACHRVCDGECW